MLYRERAQPVLSWQIIDRADQRVMQSFAVGRGGDYRRIADAIRHDLETLRRKDFEQKWGIDPQVELYSREAAHLGADDKPWNNLLLLVAAGVLVLVILGVLAWITLGAA
jgi:hypothetical protein